MNKPRILLLTAAGKTGLPTAFQLLEEGFPVTAFVRTKDARSERLKAAGADICVGSLTDVDDMRKAMAGVRRAYFNTPAEGAHLRIASVFATVAAEQRLEAVVAMSQWLANHKHPSLHTRETWLGDRLLALLPGTAVTTLNPGFFVDNDMQPLAFAAQLGLLMLPYGNGRNAPPSNEDIAAVAAEILARPEGHAGQTYRPTGPTLLSGEDMAEILSTVLGRKVRYSNTPIAIVLKVMKGFGFSDFLIAQSEQYYRDYQQGAFAVNAPTDVVRRITGREPEDFETIARRYAVKNPDAKPSFGTLLKLMALMPLWMVRPAPKTAPHLAKDDFSHAKGVSLSVNSSEWHHSHDPQPARGGAGA